MLHTIFMIFVALGLLAIGWIIVTWGLKQIPLPEPIPQVVQVIVILAMLGILLLWLLPMVMSLFGFSFG